MKASELRKLIREEIRKAIKEVDIKSVEEIGDLIDQMQEDGEGLDQGLSPSQLINYNEVVKIAATKGIRLDINKLKKLAKANDTGFMYSGAEMISQSKV
jgi:hypothetical protein